MTGSVTETRTRQAQTANKVDQDPKQGLSLDDRDEVAKAADGANVQGAAQNVAQGGTFDNYAGPNAPNAVTTKQTGANEYELSAGSNKTKVVVGEGVDANAVLPKAAQFYGDTPPEVRESIRKIEFKAEQGAPIESTDDPNDRAAAQAGGGTITFFEGDKNLDRGVFNHEVAHLEGGRKEDDADGFGEDFREVITGESGDPVPPGYQDAAKKDGNFTSTYAEDSSSATGYTEDFADGYRGYRDAASAGPEAVEAYRQKYPNRTAWFEQNYPA